MKSQPLKKYLILTVILGALPFAIYGIERTVHKLPSAKDWYATGTNHGPWRWEPEGFTVFYPIMILLVVTAVASISEAQKNKDRQRLLQGLGLVALQVAILCAQLLFLNWTVD